MAELNENAILCCDKLFADFVQLQFLMFHLDFGTNMKSYLFDAYFWHSSRRIAESLQMHWLSIYFCQLPTVLTVWL